MAQTSSACRFLKFNFVAFVTPVERTRGLNSLSVPVFTVLLILNFFFSSHCLGFKLVVVAQTSNILIIWVFSFILGLGEDAVWS